jgi:uncharacterized DUF497 family protein
MVFEFDQKKSINNKDKHGIDFEEAQLLWLDPDAVEIRARTVGEDRKLLIARFRNEFWSAVFTYRHKKIRIISVRISRENEKEIYLGKGIR